MESSGRYCFGRKEAARAARTRRATMVAPRNGGSGRRATSMLGGLISLLLLLLVLVAVGVEARLPPNQLRIGILSKPEMCTDKVERGDKISVHYIMKLWEDDKVLFNSYERHSPVEFTVGVLQIVQAWDDAVIGMCVGEKRRIVAPPHLVGSVRTAYGKAGDPPRVPPNATVVYTMELEKIVRKKKKRN